METNFSTPVLYEDGNLTLNFRTNNFGGENYYELMDDKGEIININGRAAVIEDIEGKVRLKHCL